MLRLTLLVCALAACKGKDSPPPQPKAVATDGGAGRTPDAAPGKIGSPLPEKGPHPDYPTPLAAGSDKIFTLEDPDRGAKVAPTFDLAALTKGDLAWTTHAHCVPDTVDVVCSSSTSPAHWKVGRRGKEVVVAIPSRPIDNTHVYLAKPDGTPERYVEIDSHGRVESASTFAGDRYSNRLPRGSNGLRGCGSMAFTLDKYRRVERLRCLQWSGDPMRDTRGVAATRIARDARGFITEYRYEGLDGQVAPNADNVAIERLELDREGRTAVLRYRDAADQPVASPSGCHGWRYERNAAGIVTKQTCLDAKDAPATASTGIAITTYKVDARGCRPAWRYAGSDGAPKAGGSNIHGIDLVVDDRCAELSRTCLNIVEQPIACGVGMPAKYVMKRDDLGRVTSTKHYGTDGKPAGDAQYKAFEVRWQIDDLGNRVGESCYNAAGKPIECGSTGFHAKRTTYDDAGRIAEERYYDAAGAPTTNLGTSIRRFQYDNYDHIFERKSYDVNGELVESMGQTTRRDLYDLAHRPFAVLMLDKQGNPATYTGCYTGATCPSKGGWHAVRIVRRTDGSVSKNQFFDKDGQLLQEMNCRNVPCFD